MGLFKVFRTQRKGKLTSINVQVISQQALCLFKPVDNSPLVIFRVMFGFLLLLESGGAILTGWVERVFITPSFTFTFIGFEWLQPLPGEGIYYYYAFMAFCGFMVMIGLYYKASLGAFTVLWTLAYWMQKSSYNNHYYLLILLCLLMIIMPAHRYYSLDVKMGRIKKSISCPKWCYLFIIAQLAIVYTFAGLAKIYPDWLHGLPIGIWLGSKAHYPVIGGLLQKEWLQWLVTYGGIAFDLTIVPLLLWKKTRWFAFSFAVFFHLFNSIVFQIGIFPYLMIAMLIFFFDPDKVRSFFFKKKSTLKTENVKFYAYNPLLVSIAVVYFAIQLYLPLRHLLYPGSVHWTEEGHRLAWQMMLRSKYGYIHYKVVDPQSGQEWTVNPAEYLSPKQTNKLAVSPDMIWQFSQRLSKILMQKGIKNPQVYAFARVSLNGRPLQPFIDSTVNLAEIKWGRFNHAYWILPLEKK